MNRRKHVIMIGLAALVAGAAALVYAQDGEKAGAPSAKESAEAAASGGDLPEQKSPSAAKAAGVTQPAGKGPKVLYDLGALPDPVQRMLTEIVFAAETGDMEAMRPVLESREFKPMVAAEFVADAVAYWKERSVDGSGRDVLAAMLNVLASGFVLTGEGRDAMYVWPYFAEIDLASLTPAQEVEFYRAVPPELASAMKKSGKYGYYRLGISPKGVWHYFMQ
jgi:hypothetical protein